MSQRCQQGIRVGCLLSVFPTPYKLALSPSKGEDTEAHTVEMTFPKSHI